MNFFDIDVGSHKGVNQRHRSKYFSKVDECEFSDNQITFINYSHNYCICIVDIIDSTNYTFEILNTNKVKEYYSIFLNTMSTIIKEHNGKVIKNAGDCLLYYFPKTVDQNNKSAFQDVIECGLAMTESNETLNKALNKNGLSSIQYRISGNYGKVELAMSINSHNVDLFGSPVNICSKINHLASANEMIIHNDLFEVIKKMPWHQDYVFKEINYSRINNSKNYITSDATAITNTNTISSFDKKNTYANNYDIDIVNSKNKSYDNDGYDIIGNNKNTPAAENNNVINKKYSYLAYSVHRLYDKEMQKQLQDKKQQAYLENKNNKQNLKNSTFRILLIDDDEDILFTFSQIIESHGYQITSFSNPFDALNHFSKRDPYYYDLVIMDIRMPGLNGIKLYSKIKVMNPDVKIIFLSALNALDEILSLFPEIKGSDIFRKPIEPDHLLNKISITLRN